MKSVQHIKNLEDFITVLFVGIVFSIIYFLIYRKLYFSIFDPLFYFILTIIFSSTMMVLFVADKFYVFQFFIFQLGFWYGISRFKIKDALAYEYNSFKFNSTTIAAIEIVTIILFVIVFIATIYSFMKVGLIVFSDSPTESKVSNFEGGLGFLRRINWGISPFVTCSSLILIFISKYKKLFIIIFIFQIFVTLTGGSKGALLNILGIYICLTYHPLFKNTIKFKLDLKKTIVLVLFACVFALYILMKESTKSANPFYVFLGKLYFNGDVIIYYYRPFNLEYFKDKTAFDYFYNLVNPILGMFRIVPYEYPYGYTMVKNYLLHYYPSIKLSTVLGPNNLFFVDGYIHFGLIGGVIYSCTIGWIIGFFRFKFLNYHKGDLTSFVLLFVLFFLLFTLAAESNSFSGKLFDTFFIPITMLGIVLIIFKYGIKET